MDLAINRQKKKRKTYRFVVQKLEMNLGESRGESRGEIRRRRSKGRRLMGWKKGKRLERRISPTGETRRNPAKLLFFTIGFQICGDI